MLGVVISSWRELLTAIQQRAGFAFRYGTDRNSGNASFPRDRVEQFVIFAVVQGLVDGRAFQQRDDSISAATPEAKASRCKSSASPSLMSMHEVAFPINLRPTSSRGTMTRLCRQPPSGPETYSDRRSGRRNGATLCLSRRSRRR